MIDLDHHNAIVFVFAMADCPACESYVPRLVAEIEPVNAALATQGLGFVVNPETQPAPGWIPVMVYDAASPDAAVQQLADRYGVSATPTTIVAMRGPGSFKVEGTLANNQIQWLLMLAAEAAKR